MDDVNDHLANIVRISRFRYRRLALFRAFTPLFVFVALLLALVLLNGLSPFSDIVRVSVSLATIPALALFVLYGWRRWQVFSDFDIVSELDAASSARIFTAIKDSPSKLDPSNLKLWTRYRKDLEATARTAQPLVFHKKWRQVDPVYGIRLGLPIVVLACVVYSGSVGFDRLKSFINPDIGVLFGAHKTEIIAWITPPDYTQSPPIYLTKQTRAVNVPQGSVLTIRSDVSRETFHVQARFNYEDNKRTKWQTIAGQKDADNGLLFTAILSDPAEVEVRFWGPRARWEISLINDQHPEALWVETPAINETDELRFVWQAQDDFGVTDLDLVLVWNNPNAEISPSQLGPTGKTRGGRVPHNKHNNVEKREISIPLEPQNKPNLDGVARMDLTRHAWAGMEVGLYLRATDAAQQTGKSETITVRLPEYVFIQPLARAIAEIRTIVLQQSSAYDAAAMNPASLSPIRNAPYGIQQASIMLSDLMVFPEHFYRDQALYLALQSAKARLLSARSLEEAYGVDALLWHAALKAEYGTAADAKEALEAARKALDRGLRNKAGPSTLRRLSEAYRKAAENYLSARIAEGLETEAAPQGDAATGTGTGPELSMSNIDEMLQELEALTAAGETEKAAQLLAEITQLLENLQFQRANGGGGGNMPGGDANNSEDQGDNDEEMSEFEKAIAQNLAELSDLLRRQRELNDDTIAQSRRQNSAGQEEGMSAGGDQDGDNDGDGNGPRGRNPTDLLGQNGETLLDRQEALRRLAERFGSNRGLRLGDGDEEGGAGAFGMAGDSESAGDVNPDIRRDDDTGSGGTNANDTSNETSGVGRAGQRAESQDQMGEGTYGSGLMGQTLTDREIEALQSILRDMREAEDAIGDSNYRKANNDQNKVVGSLRDLSAGLSERLDALRRQRRGEADLDTAGIEGDPLGRNLGMPGIGDDVRIPEQQTRQRSRDVLEEIRKRYSEAETEAEREYLKRLMDQF